MKNGYLEQLDVKLQEYYVMRDVFINEEKRVKEYGYDSVEYTEWIKNNHMPENPFTRGQHLCIDAYGTAVACHRDIIIFNDFFWYENDVVDFVSTLREAGIDKFILTYNGSHLMEQIHYYSNAGCSIEKCVKDESECFSFLGLEIIIN